MGLFESLPCLNGDGSVNVCCGADFGEIVGQKVAAQNLHRVVDPAVLGGGVLPEMMVSIDAQRWPIRSEVRAGVSCGLSVSNVCNGI